MARMGSKDTSSHIEENQPAPVDEMLPLLEIPSYEPLEWVGGWSMLLVPFSLWHASVNGSMCWGVLPLVQPFLLLFVPRDNLRMSEMIIVGGKGLPCCYTTSGADGQHSRLYTCAFETLCQKRNTMYETPTTTCDQPKELWTNHEQPSRGVTKAWS